MASQCPFCLKSDLPDGAARCFHCGSWLDESGARDEPFALQRQLRDDLKQDAKEHREYLEGLLAQLKYVAGTIVVLALGAAVFFGFQTDRSISDTADRITEQSSESIRQATDRITAEARDEVRESVEARMNSEATAELIERAIATTVRTRVASAIEEKFAETSAAIDAQLAASRERLGTVTGKIDELQAQSVAASRTLEAIDASFAQARRQTVASSRSVLPVEAVQMKGKGGIGLLDDILASDDIPNALTFRLGAGGYYGPIVWKYLSELVREPAFRYVLLLDGRGDIFGFYDAGALARELNPADNAAIVEAHPPGADSFPDEQRVPGWNRFAEALSRGEREALAALPTFVSGEAPCRADWSSLKALDHMERQGADKLPVVDADGRFEGFIDRSRLTTRVVLDLARGSEG